MAAAGPECSRDPCQRDWSLSCLRNCQTAVASLVFLVARIALCQATPTELVPQESERVETQTQIQTQILPLAGPHRPTPTLATTQKSVPKAPGSAIIDPNQEILRQTPRIMGILPNFTPVDHNTYWHPPFTPEKVHITPHHSAHYPSFLLFSV